MNQNEVSEVVPATGVAKRKPGRPRKFQLWFVRVARTMADGTTLPRALKQNSIVLSRRAIKLLWKSRAFKRLYKIERYVYLYRDRPANELDALRKFATERLFT